MLLLSTTRTLTSPLKSSFTDANAHAPPKQLSSLTNRNHLAPSSTSARMTATPQTSLTLSTPIIHSTGEPLKHSLKSSHSSPHVPGVRLHQRAQSEPVMPAGGSVENVHFAGEESLSTVHVFSTSKKPVNASKRQAADDTETETEYDSSSVPNGPTNFPFPIMGPSSSESDPAFQLTSMRCLSIPSTNLLRYVNVLFETGHSTLHRPSEARLRRRPQAASTLRPHTVTFPLEVKNTMSSFIGGMPATTAPLYEYT